MGRSHRRRQVADEEADRLAKPHLPAEFERSAKGLPFVACRFAMVGRRRSVSDGFPAARDPKTDTAWLTHCYGMVGAGRDVAADSSDGTSLYVVTASRRACSIATSRWSAASCRASSCSACCRAAPAAGLLREAGTILPIVSSSWRRRAGNRTHAAATVAHGQQDVRHASSPRAAIAATTGTSARRPHRPVQRAALPMRAHRLRNRSSRHRHRRPRPSRRPSADRSASTRAKATGRARDRRLLLRPLRPGSPFNASSWNRPICTTSW